MNGSVAVHHSRPRTIDAQFTLPSRHPDKASCGPQENHMPTQTTFDFTALKQGLEERDADLQLGLYDEHAEVRLVDRVNTPRAPHVLRGRDEIRAWLEDLCSRDMTHEVQMQVVADDAVAFIEACRYPDGTNALCATLLELAHGRIVRQVV